MMLPRPLRRRSPAYGGLARPVDAEHRELPANLSGQSTSPPRVTGSPLPLDVGAVDVLARQVAGGQEVDGRLVGAGGAFVVDVVSAVVHADEGRTVAEGLVQPCAALPRSGVVPAVLEDQGVAR